jgi:hypothetical protein
MLKKSTFITQTVGGAGAPSAPLAASVPGSDWLRLFIALQVHKFNQEHLYYKVNKVPLAGNVGTKQQLTSS